MTQATIACRLQSSDDSVTGNGAGKGELAMGNEIQARHAPVIVQQRTTRRRTFLFDLLPVSEQLESFSLVQERSDHRLDRP